MPPWGFFGAGLLAVLVLVVLVVLFGQGRVEAGVLVSVAAVTSSAAASLHVDALSW